MKIKLLAIFHTLFVLSFFTGCYRYPGLRYVNQEIENPAGYYVLSNPGYCILEEEYLFIPSLEDKEIFIPYFPENERQQLWHTDFEPYPDEKIIRDQMEWAVWKLSSDSPELKIKLTGKGYLLQKNVIYPRDKDPGGQIFLSFLQGDSSWEQIRRHIILTGNSLDAMKFAFVTLMTEKRELSLVESYNYLAEIAQENNMQYMYPAGYFIRRGNLIPWVWFAFKGPDDEWWYIDVANGRRDNSYFFFGNITSHHIVREYLSDYPSEYKEVTTIPPSDKYKADILHFRRPPGIK